MKWDGLKPTGLNVRLKLSQPEDVLIKNVEVSFESSFALEIFLIGKVMRLAFEFPFPQEKTGKAEVTTVLPRKQGFLLFLFSCGIPFWGLPSAYVLLCL